MQRNMAGHSCHERSDALYYKLHAIGKPQYAPPFTFCRLGDGFEFRIGEGGEGLMARGTLPKGTQRKYVCFGHLSSQQCIPTAAALAAGGVPVGGVAASLRCPATLGPLS